MIEQLHIKNFTCFRDTSFEFSKGINIFMGENGTGKTHLLKILRTITNELEKKEHVDDIRSMYFLYKVFKINSRLEILNKKNISDYSFKASYLDNELIIQGFKHRNDSERINYIGNFDKNIKGTLIPSKEILSFFNGFTALYNRREIGFDATYALLAEALDLPNLKKDGQDYKNIASFVSELKTVIGVDDIIKENGRFYLVLNGQKIESNLVAEGWRKIATLIQLIMNGEIELNENMVLLMDEPDANLNPKLIHAMAKFLIKLANTGVQIFVTTHNYLFANYLSTYAENGVSEDGFSIPDMRFFSLKKSADNIEVEKGLSLLEIDTALMDEFSSYYDFEEKLSIKKLAKDTNAASRG